MLRGTTSPRAVAVAVIAILVLAVLAYYQWLRTSMEITSVPSGAEVRINGELIGRTPLRDHALAPGMHRIEVSHSHYAVHERQLGVSGGERLDLHVRLEPGRGELVLYSNPRGAWVEVDGRRQEGTTPLLLKLPSGHHEIAMGMDERRVASQQVLVAADQSVDVRLDLNIDPHGSLWLDVVPPDAQVNLLDAGVRYQAGVRLPIGEYPVRVSRPGFVPQTLRLPVRHGDNRHRVVLERAFAALTVRTDPPHARVRIRYRQTPDSPLTWQEYQPGVRVPVGTVELRASAMGRRSVYERLELPVAGAAVNLTLDVMSIEPGTRLHDELLGGGRGPEMVVVPPGRFVMGSASGPPSERPPRRVTFTEPFAVSVTEIAAGDYRRFADATGRAVDRRLAQVMDDLPVTRVSFADAAAYAEWLSSQTGHRYRLLSEAEWEYMARAGSDDAYSFGADPGELCRHGNVADRALRKAHLGFDIADCDDGFTGLAPVGSFPANAFGIHDVHGNVAEWVLECGLPQYADAPDDGAPVDAGVDCPTHGVRGGSFDGGVTESRAGKRGVASSASGDRGIRLLREI